MNSKFFLNFFKPKQRLKGKKADLSINLIIVAIIALLVLIVTIFIFSGKMKVFGSSTDSCASKGGKCVLGVYTEDCLKSGTCDCSGENNIAIYGTDCEKSKSICCKQVF